MHRSVQALCTAAPAVFLTASGCIATCCRAPPRAHLVAALVSDDDKERALAQRDTILHERADAGVDLFPHLAPPALLLLLLLLLTLLQLRLL